MLLAAMLSDLEICMHHTLRIEAILTYALPYGIANHCKQEKERGFKTLLIVMSVGILTLNHLQSHKVKHSLISSELYDFMSYETIHPHMTLIEQDFI